MTTPAEAEQLTGQHSRRLRVESRPRAQAWASPRQTNGPADFTSLVGADGFLERRPGSNERP
jgi:hypothetical protein